MDLLLYNSETMHALLVYHYLFPDRHYRFFFATQALSLDCRLMFLLFINHVAVLVINLLSEYLFNFFLVAFIL